MSCICLFLTLSPCYSSLNAFHSNLPDAKIVVCVSAICIGHTAPTGNKYYNCLLIVISFCQWCHILPRRWTWATGTTQRTSVPFWTHGMPTITLFSTCHRGTIGGPSSPTEWVQSAAYPDLLSFHVTSQMKMPVDSVVRACVYVKVLKRISVLSLLPVKYVISYFLNLYKMMVYMVMGKISFIIKLQQAKTENHLLNVTSGKKKWICL